MEKEKSKKSKVLEGTVVSDKMAKTIVVSVVRMYKHPKYHKYIRRSKHYQVHDENNKFKIGDKVMIKETRPRSKNKSFEVITD